MYGPLSAHNPTHPTVCCDLFYRPPHMPGSGQEKKRKTSRNFRLLQELRVTEFAGGKTGIVARFHCIWGMWSVAPVRSSGEPAATLRLAHCCSPPPFKTLSLRIGSLYEWNHDWPRAIGSARQNGLKLKKNNIHPHRCILDFSPPLTTHRSISLENILTLCFNSISFDFITLSAAHCQTSQDIQTVFTLGQLSDDNRVGARMWPIEGTGKSPSSCTGWQQGQGTGRFMWKDPLPCLIPSQCPLSTVAELTVAGRLSGLKFNFYVRSAELHSVISTLLWSSRSIFSWFQDSK